MNILDHFEQGVERVMEGGAGRLFRSPVLAADIGQHLERAMRTALRRSGGRQWAPDQYLVRLHPDDLARFAGYQPALESQLAEWLRGRINERGAEPVAPVRVTLAADLATPRRHVRVAVDRSAAPAGVAYRVRFLNGPRRGQALAVPPGGLTLGRDVANDVVVAVTEVSRHHARFERAGDRLRVVDLGSTNGTRVNQRPVRQATLRPGDEVTFGTIRLQVSADD